jgi:hypothetical protein
LLAPTFRGEKFSTEFGDIDLLGEKELIDDQQQVGE